MNKLATAALVFFMATQANAEILTLDQITQATCRVTAVRRGALGTVNGVGRGTGTVISENKDSYFIMTNGHVATNEGTINHVEFYPNGVKTEAFDGTVVWRSYVNGSSVDFALIRVLKSEMGDFRPRVIELATKKVELKEGDRLYGAGCPEGRWMQTWRTTLKSNSDHIMRFHMPPVGGQSGSAVLKDVDGDTKVVGMVTWRFGSGSNSDGGGLNINRILNILTGKPKADNVNVKYRLPVLITKCEHCGNDKGKHRRVISADGKLSKELFCPKTTILLPPGATVKTLDELEKEAKAKETQRPPIGDILPDADEELKKVQDQLKKVLEQKLALEKILGKTAEEKEKADRDLKAISKENKTLAEEKVRVEGENTVLAEKNRQLSEKLEEFLNGLNVPQVNEWFGMGLGSLLNLLLGAIAGGTLVPTVWVKFLRPYLMKNFGYLPTKLIYWVGKPKIEELFAKQEAEETAIVKNVSVEQAISEMADKKASEYKKNLIDKAYKAINDPDDVGD